MNSCPSASRSFDPLALTHIRGGSSARVEEFTPPGVLLRARSNEFWEAKEFVSAFNIISASPGWNRLRRSAARFQFMWHSGRRLGAISHTSQMVHLGEQK